MAEDTNPTPAPAKKAAAKKAAAKKAAGPAPTAAPRAPGRPSNRDKLAEQIAGTYTNMALMLAVVPHPGAQAVGLATAQAAPEIGQRWADLCEQNPTVKRYVEKALTASTVGALVSAHMPILLAGLVATGNVPEALAGLFVAPEPGA